MSLSNIQRPALGQWEDLGALYDARTDRFISRSLLRGDTPETAVQITRTPQARLDLRSQHSYKEKFAHLNVGIELATSFLSGLIQVSGSGEYLNETHDSKLIDHAAVHCTVTTVEEVLSLGHPDLTPYIDGASIPGSGATHVLMKIGWGAQTIVSASFRIGQADEQQVARSQIEVEFQRIRQAITSGGHNGFPYSAHQPDDGVPFEVIVYSDLRPPSRNTDLHQACNLILELPSQIAAANNGNGMPLTYTLVPLGMLQQMLNVPVDTNWLFCQPPLDCLEEIQELFDELRGNRQRLNDHHQDITSYHFCVPAQHLDHVKNYLKKSDAAMMALQSEFARLLVQVRANRVDAAQLRRLVQEARQSVLSTEDVAGITNQYSDKIAFAGRVKADRISYLIHQTATIEAQLARSGVEDAFMLFFNGALMAEPEIFEESYNLLLQRQQADSYTVVGVVDCDVAGVKLDKIVVSRFLRGKLLIPDVLDHLKNERCYARCVDREELYENNEKKPSRRSAVKLACSGPNCDQNLQHDWICHTCKVPIEYGPEDQYIYCDCGRSFYTNYGFRCNSLDHGKLFERFENRVLLQTLNSLDPMKEVNILIIGETGVGKSTFINAFINYLSYDTLDEAMSNEDLDWVIPCSFKLQRMDRSDPYGGIKEVSIRVGDVGQGHNEADGSEGESATQKPMVYPVSIGDTVVRLIDTPGIGDTRGVEIDGQNMANIIGMLSNFDAIHGILFLLKSNNNKLNLMFRFVMEELLTHLHRDAAQNMVFGFTNTRMANFTPGDALAPLRRQLSTYDRVKITLSSSTVYCFDSESFRFLAAQKTGEAMENIQDFRLSWEKSEHEAKRLIEHFSRLNPHDVTDTLSLNRTRELILHLTKPMAEIMQQINRTIEINADRVQELADTKLKGDDLRNRLHFQQMVLETQKLEHPRTVCNDALCKDYRDDTDGATKTVYKSICHNRCYLTSIEVNTVGVHDMRHCEAFDGKEECKVCGHRWDNHLHVTYHLEERLKTVENKTVVQQLARHESDVAVKETAIQNLKAKIEQCREEYQEILDAAVKFGVFLKKRSIKPYNDVMADYLRILIKEEHDKVKIRGDDKRLIDLQRHLIEHEQQVTILSTNVTGDPRAEILDEAGVEDLVNHLYGLKHWGTNLREIMDAAGPDSASIYVEKRVRPGRSAQSKSSRLSNLAAGSNLFGGGGAGLAANTYRRAGEPQRRPSTLVSPPYQSRTSIARHSPTANRSTITAPPIRVPNHGGAFATPQNYPNHKKLATEYTPGSAAPKQQKTRLTKDKPEEQEKPHPAPAPVKPSRFSKIIQMVTKKA